MLDQVLSVHQKYAKTLNEEASHNFVSGLVIIASIAVLFVVVIFAVSLLMKRVVFAPVNLAREHCRQIAAGKLDVPVPIKRDSGNEIDHLMSSMEQMRQALLSTISQVRDASHTVTHAAQEIASGNIDLASRTEQQASALTQTAASMEEITATVKLNADNAEQAHQLAKSVSDTADHGSEMVCYVIEKMRDISGSSARIADILSVIDGIAFQTNILALNASVEAARAGEQGRGFAVVAGEVRNLASRSADAAKEIRSLISDSQTHVNEGSELAQQAGETMDEIATEVLRMTKLMREIATASQEQSRGIEQVNIAVNQMDETAQQNAALVQQSSAATRSLEEQSRELMEAMASFKLTTQTA